ncbi:MAG: host-nuclease inhibitor Gam family protein [Paludibacteraceae bacterium]|nr:host-nuclease inhibitor Gam family protein [Paludibacteraceae bacterium]
MEKETTKATEIAEETTPAEATPGTETEAELPAATLDELEGMDMEAFANEEAPEGPRRWRIADDDCADWAVRKIADERAELARIKELADAQIARIMDKVVAADKRCENGTRFLTSKLAEYFETVPHKQTKTKHTYRLLSGTLARKIGGTTMKQNTEKLLEYLKASGNDDMIKLTEEPKWGEFKKRLEIVGDQIIDKDTGELVEGVELVGKPDTFVVEI